MTGYVRKDTTNNIADGNVINAADLDSEFDGVQAAFNSSTGHTHDGSSAEGAPITKLGPVQDVTISTTVLGVKTTNTVDLGTSSLKFKDFYLAGNASIGGTLTYGGVTLSNAVTGTGSMVLSASPTITGTITAAAANFSGAVALNGNTTLGDADTDTITQAASYVTGTQLKSAKTATNTLSLAAYDVDGTAYTNLITLTASNTPTLALTSTGVGSMDNIAIGATTASTGAFTTLSANSTVTLSGGTANGVAYLNGSKVVTTGSALTFDGTNFGVTTIKSTTSLNLYAASAYDVNLYTGATNTARLSSNVNGIFTVGDVGSVGGLGTNYGTIGAWGTAGGGYRIYRGTGAGTSIAYLYADASGVFLTGQENVPMSFSVNGSEAMRIASATGGVGAVGIGYSTLTSVGNNGLAVLGNVGIGTSSPASKLEVRDTNPTILLSNTASRYGYIQWENSGSQLRIGTDGAFNIRFDTNASQKMLLDTSGNLGVGVTPSANAGVSTLNIANYNRTLSALTLGSNGNSAGYVGYNMGNTSTANLYRYIASDTGSAIYFAGNEMRFMQFASGSAGATTNGTQAMTLDASGNLGIGTTSPSDTIGYGRALDIQSTTGAAIYLRDSDNPTTQYAAIAFDGNASVNNLNIINSSSTGPIRLFTNGAERARIDSSGNLLVGAGITSSINGTFCPIQALNNTANQVAYFRNSNANPSGTIVNYSGASPNNTGNEFVYCSDSTAQRASFRSNGGVANYSANNVNLSDRREKTNFAPAKSYLDVICAIPVQTFNYIDQNMEDDGGLTLGVVAQDVQAVAPELVMESNWAKDGDEPKMRLSIYQTDLQYALMKCIQEQQALITQLTARITALEGA